MAERTESISVQTGGCDDAHHIQRQGKHSGHHLLRHPPKIKLNRN